MIIQSKIQSRGFQIRSLGAIGVWSVALLCGSIVAACSGSIETPTEEFPPRTSGGSQQAQTADNTNTPPRSQTQTANDDDDDDDAAAADDEDPPAGDDEDPPAGDDEDPPAGDDEDPAAGDDEEPAAGALSFEADIHPIFSPTCGPGHAGAATAGVDIGNPDIDTALESARDFEDRVLTRIAEGGMPPTCLGGAPGDSGCIAADDLAAIEAWYEAGAPE
jgi:hypothetical protein